MAQTQLSWSNNTVSFLYDQEVVAWQQIKVFSSAQYTAGGFNPASSTATYDSGQIPHPTGFAVSSGALSHPVLGTGTYRAYVGYDGGAIPAAGFVQFSVVSTPAAPTDVTPLAGSTVNTSTPTATATLAAVPTGATQRLEFQFATNSGFTTGLVNVAEPTSALRASGTGSATVPLGQRLAQGTWYVRARGINNTGEIGPWSAGNQFTVSHLPAAASMSPTGGAAIPWNGGSMTYDWDFTDPWSGDQQSAYQVEVSRLSDGVVIQDSGKQTSANTFRTATLPSGTTYRDVALRWRVRLYDLDDVVGNWSAYQAFIPSQTPSPVFVNPTAAQVLNTPQPTIQWTFSGAVGRTQASYRVRINDTSSSVLVYDSGVVTSSSGSHALAAPSLSNSEGYTLTIDLVDNLGVPGTGSITFTTSWTPPATPSLSVSGTGYDDVGYANLTWPTSPAADFVSWNIYRKLNGASTWELIAVDTQGGARAYHDWLAGAGYNYDYALTQVALVFGVPVESNKSQVLNTNLADDRYHLIHPTDETLNLVLYVTTDNFKDETEKSEILLRGRGRKANFGTRWGVRGTLTASIRDRDGAPAARLQRLGIKDLIDEKLHLYLRTPFGDVWKVMPDDVNFDRMPGVGQREWGTITLPYAELG